MALIPPPDPGRLYQVEADFDAALQAREADALARLRGAYESAGRAIEQEIHALDEAIKSAQRRGIDVSEREWKRARLERLRAQVEAAAQAAQSTAAAETTAAQAAHIADGAAQTAHLIQSQRDAGGADIQIGDVTADESFSRANLRAVQAGIGFFGDGSPLKETLEARAPNLAEGYVDLIADQLTQGWNPRKAALIAANSLKVDYQHSETVLRTESLRALRAANRAVMIDHTDLLDGWIWNAHLDDPSRRTCAACIAMHGTLHKVGEPMGTHVNCRCAQIPAVQGAESLWRTQTGEAWFAAQEDAVQIEILGKAKQLAYKAGEFDLPDLVGFTRDPDWGPIRWETSLADAIKTADRKRGVPPGPPS